jgi:hypothetical protein
MPTIIIFEGNIMSLSLKHILDQQGTEIPFFFFYVLPIRSEHRNIYQDKTRNLKPLHFSICIHISKMISAPMVPYLFITCKGIFFWIGKKFIKNKEKVQEVLYPQR